MEHNDEKIKLGFREWLQIGWLIATVVFICALIFSIIVFLKNVEEVKIDPINYAIDNSDISSCTCFDIDGNFRDFWGSEGQKEVIENRPIGNS